MAYLLEWRSLGQSPRWDWSSPSRLPAGHGDRDDDTIWKTGVATEKTLYFGGGFPCNRRPEIPPAPLRLRGPGGMESGRCSSSNTQPAPDFGERRRRASRGRARIRRGAAKLSDTGLTSCGDLPTWWRKPAGWWASQRSESAVGSEDTDTATGTLCVASRRWCRAAEPQAGTRPQRPCVVSSLAAAGGRWRLQRNTVDELSGLPARARAPRHPRLRCEGRERRSESAWHPRNRSSVPDSLTAILRGARGEGLPPPPVAR